jgi:hypothetical protein
MAISLRSEAEGQMVPKIPGQLLELPFPERQEFCGAAKRDWQATYNDKARLSKPAVDKDPILSSFRHFLC